MTSITTAQRKIVMIRFNNCLQSLIYEIETEYAFEDLFIGTNICLILTNIL